MTVEDKRIAKAVARVHRPTPGQLKFLDGLFIDCYMAERSQRNAFCERRVHREIRFLDDLTFGEASSIIDELKEKRDRDRASYLKEKDDA
jgi:hypothetical protein